MSPPPPMLMMIIIIDSRAEGEADVMSSVARQLVVEPKATEAKPTELTVVAREPKAIEPMIIMLLVVMMLVLLILTVVEVILFDLVEICKILENFGRAEHKVDPSRVEHFHKRSIFGLDTTINR